MSASLPAAEPTAVPKNVRWVLLGVMLAILLSMLDNMVVSTAMPTIVGGLGGLNHISWVVTAYTLVTAVTTPAWGKFGELYVRKRMYLTSIAVFIVGSALCGASQSMTELIAFRIGVGAVLALIAFITVEKRVGEPLVPLGVFTNHRNYPPAMVMILVAGVVMFGAGLYLPLFQQTVQGASATNSGLLMLLMMVPVVIVSTIAGKVMSATGRYKIFPVLGTAFLTAGLGLLTPVDTHTSYCLTSTYMILVGIGLGFTMQMSGTIAQNSVSLRDMGAAMSSVNLFRALGGSLGVAVFGSLFTRAVQPYCPRARKPTSAP